MGYYLSPRDGAVVALEHRRAAEKATPCCPCNAVTESERRQGAYWNCAGSPVGPLRVALSLRVLFGGGGSRVSAVCRCIVSE